MFQNIKEELKDEYLQHHNWPWIIGYSGGKDSSLVAHLAFECLMEIAPSRRKRKIHIVANDTLVESPPILNHLLKSVKEIENAASAFNLPVIVKVTRPQPDQTFWVNMIGRGYVPPHRLFRWCTDRMKIKPTSLYIQNLANEERKVILLLGVRRTESAARSVTVGKYDTEGRLHKHNSLKGCYVYRPIVELNTDDVWEYLGENEPPWGGSHLDLINLYRNAHGGECPVVLSKDDAPSCGTTSPRFGCWTCSVVKKDRSLEGFVDSGFEEFNPLLEFRDWLISIRSDKERRYVTKKTGKAVFKADGTLIPGPFTIKARMEILQRLTDLEERTGKSLIKAEEIDTIHSLWSEEMTLRSHAPITTTTIGTKARNLRSF